MSAPRLMICGTHSGSGKTTVTCGLLRALLRRGLAPAAFKCGPDYIDPMFHSTVIGAQSRNLDSYFADADTVRYLLERNSAGRDVAVIEGVMGYYDGIAATETASSHHVASVTQTPAVLVVNAKGMSRSAAAIVGGFRDFADESRIRGVLLNQASPSLYPELKRVIEERCGVAVYGYLPPSPELVLGSRHLGLVLPHEVDDLRRKLDLLAEKMEQTVNIAGLLELAATAPKLDVHAPELPKGDPVRVAVARDEAFCFYYEDNLALLRDLGAELVPFSPLRDARLPEGAAGLWLGGGYPELCADKLSANVSMREAVRRAMRGGMPTIAECGGFMYLHRTLRDIDGKAHAMCGVVDGEVRYTGKLRRFGYVELEMRRTTPFGDAGCRLRGHEFHYFDSDNPGDALRASKPVRGSQWECAVATDDMLCGFPHYYLYSNPTCAARFLDRCRRYAGQCDEERDT